MAGIRDGLNGWFSLRSAESCLEGRTSTGDQVETPGWILVDHADWQDLEAAVSPTTTVSHPPAPAAGGGCAASQPAVMTGGGCGAGLLRSSTGHSTDFIPLPATAFRADPRSMSQADTPSLQPVTDIQNFTAWVDAWQDGAPGENSLLTQPVVHAMWLQVASLPNTAVTPMLWATAHINSLAQQVAAHTKEETAAARLLLPHDTPCTVKGSGKASARSSQTGM